MEEKTIYNIKLHHSVEVSEGVFAFRVPSGWIYEYHTKEWSDDGEVLIHTLQKVAFVPYDNMFKGSDKS